MRFSDAVWGCLLRILRRLPSLNVSLLLLVYILVFPIVVIDAYGIRTPLHLPALRRIAKYSFGIYLIHSIVATILFQVLSPKLVSAQNISFDNVHSFGALLRVAAGLVITLVLAKGRLKTVELYGAHGVRMMLGPKKMPVAATS